MVVGLQVGISKRTLEWRRISIVSVLSDSTIIRGVIQKMIVNLKELAYTELILSIEQKTIIGTCA
jgi:hypothetical protein